MEGESGEQVGDVSESVTSSAECFMQGWRNEIWLIHHSVGISEKNYVGIIRQVAEMRWDRNTKVSRGMELGWQETPSPAD